MRRSLRRALLRGVTASVVLPMVIAVVVGTGALLSSLGDRAGATGALRVAQAGAVAWVVAIVATTVLGGLAALDDGPDHGHRRGPRSRRGGPPDVGPAWDARAWRGPRRCGPRRRRGGHGRRHHRAGDASEGHASGRGEE